MAKSRKQKSALKQSIRFEIYGILLIVLSLITMAQLGHVGEFIMTLFRVCIGNWGFLFSLIGIYLSIYIMIKRTWPSWFTIKKTGFLFVLIGLLLVDHMRWFDSLYPDGGYTATTILSTTWDTIIVGLKQSSLLTVETGGGFIGGLVYGGLFYFFDQWGVRLVQIALFAVGTILFIGMSYVDMVHKVKARWVGISQRLNLRSVLAKKQKQRLSAEIAPSDEQVEPLAPQSKKPSTFQSLIEFAQNVTTKAPEDQVALSDKAPSTLPVIEDSTRPVIRDFQEVVHQEMNSDVSNHASSPMATSALHPKNKSSMEHNEDPTDLAFSPSSLESVPYQLPDMKLLDKPNLTKNAGSADYKANARKLEALLESFGVKAKVLEIVRGPAVTRYEIQPDVGVKVSKIVSLTDDIALSLAAKDIRMEAPIPGKAAIGIEVPNTEVSIVTMREVMETATFQDASSHLTVVLGRDISGQPIVGNLSKMPHLLVAGATGSGKSVCINGIITSILFKASPQQVKFLMIDPKMVELNVYNGIPHLLAPVVTDSRRASLALKKVVVEMEKRYELFSKSGTRNIEGYNMTLSEQERLPFIVVIVDELADLMMVAAGDVEDAICRLAQMARAAGIHLIIATQRPSVDVITGVIKANIPSRIAFGVSSQVDSRTILDMVGAEKLLGRGDMLYLPAGASKPTRVQGAFLSDNEVERVVHFVCSQEKAVYIEDMVPMVEDQPEKPEDQEDELFEASVRIVLEAKQASVSLLQRRMRIGYTRAARLIDVMEAKGVIGPYEGSKPREVRMTFDQYQRMRGIVST